MRQAVAPGVWVERPGLWGVVSTPRWSGRLAVPEEVALPKPHRRSGYRGRGRPSMPGVRCRLGHEEVVLRRDGTRRCRACERIRDGGTA